MSYSIIYQTKIVRLEDGRLLHLSRQGCNNDTAGREKGVFEGTVFTPETFEDFIKGYEESGEGDCEIKIASRWTDLRGYGKHLRRMLKKPLPGRILKMMPLKPLNAGHI